jgi:hypothetical protein
MKKSLLLLSVLFVLGYQAQNTIQLTKIFHSDTSVVSANAVISLTASYGTTQKLTFDIKNISNAGHTYNVKRYDVALNSFSGDTAVAYFCFAGLCYDKSTHISPSPITLAAGKSASDTSAQFYMLVAYLDDAPKKGCSEVRYTFFNVDNVSDSAQVIVNYNCAAPVGISSLKNDVPRIEIYPNPARNSATLKIDSKESAEILAVLYNSLGQLVLQKEAVLQPGRNNVALDISAMPAGIYVLKAERAGITETRKLIIN